MGGSNATAKADGAADRATRVTAPGERLQSAVNKVQQRVKQAVDNVSKRVSGEKPSNESGSENADDVGPYCGVFTHLPASPTMPTGTAPDRLTFCTLGPEATIVVS